MRIFIFLISFLLFTTLVCAKNFYVSPSGSDSEAGSIASPFRTIQHGVNQLKSGDTLFLREGSYHEEVVINNLNGASGAEVVIEERVLS